MEEKISQPIEEFLNGREVDRRDTSYDFCYGYFQTHRHHLSDDMERSCLHLWAYLASWGMLRGSSQLLQTYNMKVLSGLVEYLDKLDDECWSMDVPDYTNEAKRKKIVEVYSGISEELEKIKVSATPTLITKIMLGTLGCVPALDVNFNKCFGCYKLNEKLLSTLADFYNDHKSVFNEISVPVLDFDGKSSELYYKKAKLLDMYGFQKGLEINKDKTK